MVERSRFIGAYMKVGDLVRYTGKVNSIRYTKDKRLGIIVRVDYLYNESTGIEEPMYRCLFGKDFVWHFVDCLEIIK